MRKGGDALTPLRQNAMDRIMSWDAVTPQEPSAADSVEDAFELLAPSVHGPLVARLIPLHNIPGKMAIVEIHRDTGTITLGRSKELIMECRINAAQVSGRHCELRVDPTTQQVYIRDISTNGTYINRKRLEKNVDVELQSGDRVSFMAPSLCPDDTAEVEAHSQTGSDAAVQEFSFQRIGITIAADKLEEELTCSVCKFLYLRPCIVLPCMHVFCAACISRRIAGGPTTCIKCRTELTEVRPTQKIQNRVEQLLKAKPHLARSAEEQNRLTALDDIPPKGMRLLKRRREQGIADEEDDDDDEETGYDDDDEHRDMTAADINFLPIFVRSVFGQMRPTGPCRQCESASAVDGFRCLEDAMHQSCMQCHRLFPHRPLCNRPQCCQLCSIPFCNLYYKGEGGCPGGNSGLTRLRQYQLASSLPRKTFGGNAVERAILSKHLAAKNVGIEAVWEECMAKMEKGEWIPDIACVNGELTVDSALCKSCKESVFASLLFHYRRAVPNTELSDSVTSRPNCWHGLNCRTQFHAVHHAKKYNHVCYEEKRKE